MGKHSKNIKNNVGRQMRDVNLADIDGIELTAFEFIEKCEDARHYIHSQRDYGRVVRDPRGYSNIKKLKDEIIPISLYLQYLRHIGNDLEKLKIIWKKGNQKGDAQIFDGKWLMLEVTTARHQNEYLVRHRVNQSGGSFTADGLTKTNSGIESKPVVLDYGVNVKRYYAWVCEQIAKKSEGYRGGTIRLIVHVIQDGLILDSEIDDIEKHFSSFKLPGNIEHVFISFGDRKKFILIKNNNNT